MNFSRKIPNIAIMAFLFGATLSLFGLGCLNQTRPGGDIKETPTENVVADATTTTNENGYYFDLGYALGLEGTTLEDYQFFLQGKGFSYEAQEQMLRGFNQGKSLFYSLDAEKMKLVLCGCGCQEVEKKFRPVTANNSEPLEASLRLLDDEGDTTKIVKIKKDFNYFFDINEPDSVSKEDETVVEAEAFPFNFFTGGFGGYNVVGGLVGFEVGPVNANYVFAATGAEPKDSIIRSQWNKLNVGYSFDAGPVQITPGASFALKQEKYRRNREYYSKEIVDGKIFESYDVLPTNEVNNNAHIGPALRVGFDVNQQWNIELTGEYLFPLAKPILEDNVLTATAGVNFTPIEQVTISGRGGIILNGVGGGVTVTVHPSKFNFSRKNQ